MRLSTKTGPRAALLAVCAAAGLAIGASATISADAWAVEEPAHPESLDRAIIAAAKRHGVPERLVRRVIMRESKYNPRARNRRYWGLMQISYPTARSMGFKGTPQELLNPVVNLRYAVPYLANAFICAGKRDDAAVRLYAAGYYFTARTRGLLAALRTAESAPLNGVADEPEQTPLLAANASAQPPESVGVFGALFNPGQQPQPDAQPQPQAQPQVAAYSADASAAPQPQQRPVAVEASRAPAGTFNGPTIAMETGRNGEAALPKKWKRDGGMTVIARGEQGLDKVASRDPGAAAGTPDSGRHSRRHARKITLVASIDAQPSTAQAYAAAPAQDPRFAAAPSQAAIAQATSGATPGQAQQVDIFGQPMSVAQPAPAPAQPAAAVESSASQPTAAPATKAAADDDEKPKKRRSRRARHHKAKTDTQVAESKPAAEAGPALRPSETQ